MRLFLAWVIAALICCVTFHGRQSFFSGLSFGDTESTVSIETQTDERLVCDMSFLTVFLSSDPPACPFSVDILQHSNNNGGRYRVWSRGSFV